MQWHFYGFSGHACLLDALFLAEISIMEKKSLAMIPLWLIYVTVKLIG